MMESLSLSRNELEEIAKSHLGFHGLDISRISTILIAQVLQMHANRTVNTYNILDEIKFLEGLNIYTATEPESEFRHHPLKGLMKKHFTDASFIVKNIGAHLGMDYGGNSRLTNLIQEAFNKNESGYADDEFFLRIAHGMTCGALEERAKNNRTTGEWIVFKKYDGKNYYLTLAAHKEGDDNIYKKVCDSYDIDFSFLR